MENIQVLNGNVTVTVIDYSSFNVKVTNDLYVEGLLADKDNLLANLKVYEDEADNAKLKEKISNYLGLFVDKDCTIEEWCELYAPDFGEHMSKYLSDLREETIAKGRKFEFVDYLIELSKVTNYELMLKRLAEECVKAKNLTLYDIVGSLITDGVRKVKTDYPEFRISVWIRSAILVLIADGMLKVMPKAIKADTDQDLVANGLRRGMIAKVIFTPQLYGKAVQELHTPSNTPKRTKKLLGSVWCKGIDEIDCCLETVNLSNHVKLKYNEVVWKALDEAVGITIDVEDCPEGKSFEQYKKEREKQFHDYLGKFADYIGADVDNEREFFNTYEPDFRGRLYVNNDTGNFIGIKEIRALVQPVRSARVESSLVEDLKVLFK